jgi:hypothetical protein
MGESNYRDSRMAAYQQEVRKLEENLMVLSFIISSNQTTKQLMPSLSSG